MPVLSLVNACPDKNAVQPTAIRFSLLWRKLNPAFATREIIVADKLENA